MFVDGKLVERVFYANTLRGIVRAFIYPFRLNRWRKRALSKTLRGNVEVRITNKEAP